MDSVLKQVFKNKTVDIGKLKNFGFKKIGEFFEFSTFILNNQMKLTVKIKDNEIKSEVYDIENDEPYTLFLVEGVAGKFVGEVRQEYQKVLEEISDKCFNREIFKSEQSKRVINYVKSEYGDELEFLWEKFDNNAIWRRKDNRKWYGLLVTLSKRKLGIESDENVEIIILRMKSEDIVMLVDNEKYFPAYHMNKKNWVTICLDGKVDLKEICERIDQSYILASKK